MAALSGLPLPVYSDGLHVNVTEPRERMLTPMLQHIRRRLTLKQAANGTFIIGGGWPAQPQRPPARYSVRWDSAAGNTAVAVRVMPALRDVRIMHMWTGVIAFTDDLLPVVGEYRRLPGYYLCLASTGFTLGPIIAKDAGRAPGRAGRAYRAARRVPPRPIPRPPAVDEKEHPWTVTTWTGRATGHHVRPCSGRRRSLDLDATARLLEFYVSCGLHGVLINGTVGEWFSQTSDARRLPRPPSRPSPAG